MNSDEENRKRLPRESIDSGNFKGLEPCYNNNNMDTDGENQTSSTGTSNNNNNSSSIFFTSSSSGDYTDATDSSSDSSSESSSEHSSIASGSSNSTGTVDTEQYSSFLRVDDSKDLIETQLEHFMELNKNNLENLDGTAPDDHTTRLFFHFCKKLALEGVVKLHGMELYYKWLSVVCQETKHLRPVSRPNFEQRLKNEMFIRMATCIQLASKYVGGQFSVGYTTSVVTAKKLRRLLAKFDCKVSYQDLRDSEIRIFTALKYNLNTLTPLEMLGHILSLLDGFDRGEFHNLFSFCVNICYLTYLEKEPIYQDYRKRVLKKYGQVFTNDQIVKLERDYTLRAAAIIQAAMLLHQVDHPDVSFLQKLENIIQSSSPWQHIYELALSIFSKFFS